MDRKKYLLLLALSQASTVYGLGLYARLRRDVDPLAKAAWLDARGMGLFIATALPARKVWELAVPDNLPTEELAAFSDMLLLELGQDHMGLAGNAALQWLAAPDPR